MILLCCDDFREAGFLEERDCCPYCHQDDGYLFLNNFVVEMGEMKAAVCCMSYKKIVKFTNDVWLQVVDYKGK